MMLSIGWSRSVSIRKMFDLGVKAATGCAAWRRLSITMTQVDRRNEDVMDADQTNPLLCRPHAGGPSRRRFCAGRGAGLGAVALAPVLAAGPPQARLTARGRRERPDGLRPELEVRAGQPGRDYRPTGAYANAMGLASTTPAGSSWTSRTD